MPAKFKEITIGSTFQDKRKKFKISLDEIEHELKIKKKFLKAIESNDFKIFRSHTQAKGFIRNYARLMDIPEETLNALYRRDVENLDKKREVKMPGRVKKPVENEKATNGEKFRKLMERLQKFNNPKVLKLIMASALILITLFFAGRFVQMAFQRPYLKITAPFELVADYDGRIEYFENSIRIEGQTQDLTIVTINGRAVSIMPDYSFRSDEIATGQDENVIIISAENNLGSKSEIKLNLVKPQKKFDQINLTVKTGEEMRVIIKADNIIRYNQVATVGEEIRIEAESKLEMFFEKPDAVEMLINQEPFKLTGTHVNFVNKASGIEEVRD